MSLSLCCIFAFQFITICLNLNLFAFYMLTTFQESLISTSCTQIQYCIAGTLVSCKGKTEKSLKTAMASLKCIIDCKIKAILHECRSTKVSTSRHLVQFVTMLNQPKKFVLHTLERSSKSVVNSPVSQKE